MSSHFALEIVLGLGPVLLLLAGLLYLDSFKLVGLPMVLAVAVMGAATAALSYFVSGGVMDGLHISFPAYSRYAAPVVEECLKASVMLYLFARNRIGFMVDAAILGLAVGAGFSVFENIYYAYIFPDAVIGTWVVRGLGTAVMHGGVTAVFGIAAQALSERHARFNPVNYLPGLLMAIAIHSIFNQFTDYPTYSTAATIIGLPLVLLLVFGKSEEGVHNWLVQDYESHEHLLQDIGDGKFADSEAGRFIVDLAKHLDSGVAANLFAYMKLHTELVLRAEHLLMAKEKGEAVRADKSTAEDFKKLHALESAIGRTAMLTVWPHLKFSHQELWELHQLEGSAARTA